MNEPLDREFLEALNGLFRRQHGRPAPREFSMAPRSLLLRTDPPQLPTDLAVSLVEDENGSYVTGRWRDSEPNVWLVDLRLRLVR